MQPDWLSSPAQWWIVAMTPIMLSTLGGGLIFGLVFGLYAGLVFGLGAVLILWLFQMLIVLTNLAKPTFFKGGEPFRSTNELFRITPVEAVRWSWRKAQTHWLDMMRPILHLALCGGLVIGLFFGLTGLVGGLYRGGLAASVGVAGLVLGPVLGGLLFVLVFVVVALSPGWLFGGLITDQIVNRTVPNEGIQRSLRNALISVPIFGLAFGLYGGLFGLLWELLFELASGPLNKLVRLPGQVLGLLGTNGGLLFGLLFGLAGGLDGWMRNGGSAYLKHYVLRFLLWLNDYAPPNYIRFLDYATERVFLRKVGGGYIFTHRLLMEYFAMLGPIEQAKAEQRQ
jgi:hypothetical protein